MRLPDFSVRRPVTVSMLILIVVVLGVTALSRMGLDLMPDITFPLLTVVTPYEGVSSEEIENIVTRPIEEAVAMTRNVTRINSISMEGFSAVMAEYSWGTSIEFAAQDIRDRIDMFTSLLPADMGDPQVIKFDPGLIPVAGWGITGDVSLEELRRICDDEIQPRLQQVDGVSAVYVFGGLEREIRAELETGKLRALGVPAGMVAGSIASGNINVAGGRVTEGYRELALKGSGEFRSISDIENTLVTYREGTPVFVKDLGRVVDGHREVRTLARTNSEPSILIMAFKETAANTVLVADRVTRAMNGAMESLPGDIQAHAFIDLGRMIRRILNVTLTSALWGSLLAVIILFVFLRSWRPTAVIATAIPLSILATFLPLYMSGYTINFVILIGVALGVGMIVDNAIVVIENSFRQLSITGDPKEAAAKGAGQVGMAITASTFTTVVVFIPLLFAGGVVGKIFSQLAVTVASALICSLIVALTIIPMLGSKLFARVKHRPENGWMTRLRRGYEKRLSFLLDNKKKAFAIVGGVLLLSIAAFPLMPREYFPDMETSFLMMNLRRGIGTVLEETDRAVKSVEGLLREQEGIDVYSVFLGVMEGGEIDAAMGTGPSGPHEATFFLSLQDRVDRRIGDSQIRDSVRRGLPVLEDAEFEFTDMGQAMMTGGSQQYPIHINVYGPDVEGLREVAGRIRDSISGISGIIEAATTLDRGRPEYTFAVNRKEAARLGISAFSVGNTLSAVRGLSAGYYREQGKEYPISVTFRKEDRSDIRRVGEVPVISDDGRVFSLSQLSSIRETEGPVRLERIDRRRVVSVTANYENVRFSDVIGQVRRAVRGVDLPPGYSVEYAGEAEDVQEMFTTLLQLFLLAILLIYMVMAAQFESFIQPAMIMFTIPLAWVGVVWFLLFTGKSISMPSGMGILILFGIVVNNAIVLIDYINQLRRDSGLGIRKAVLEASSVRLRPIMMTASTTIMAMVPMALSRMEGAGIRSVVAISIIGGLFAGTFLTLFVIPLIYESVELRLEKRRARKAAA